VGKTWSDRLIFAGGFLLLFGAYLVFLKGPAVNQQQQFFRIGIFAVGLVLGLIGAAMKLSGGRRGGS
jgi:hypothetical protein